MVHMYINDQQYIITEDCIDAILAKVKLMAIILWWVETNGTSVFQDCSRVLFLYCLCILCFFCVFMCILYCI